MRPQVLFCLSFFALVFGWKQQEYQALQQIYSGLNVPSWNISDTNYCSYPFITCQAGRNDTILSINLRGQSLSGGLTSSPTAWNLTDLITLDLSGNYISGTLPAAMAQGMPQLQYLNASSTSLSGTVPGSFANLTELTHFDIDLGNLVPIGIFRRGFGLGPGFGGPGFGGPGFGSSASKNTFNGQLPDFSAAKNLTYFSAVGTAISGNMFEMTGLTKLSHLDLSKTSVAGPIPDSINEAVSLTYLNLQDTLVTAMPKSMSNLVNLQQIYLGLSQVSGPITPDLGSCVSLTTVDMNTNTLTGPLPDLINCTSLQSFIVTGNRLTGKISAFWADLPQLSQLYLDNNEFTGVIPEWKNTTVAYLQLNNNQLTGQIPASVFNLSELQVIDVSNNMLTGPPPFPNTNNTAIISINYSGNKLTGVIPTLSNVTSLLQLRVNFNKLSGSIPDLPINLQNLYLAGNNFQGNLPLSISNLTAIVNVDLSYNALSGQIPLQLFAQNVNLKMLRLTGNNFTGTIPSFVTNSELQELMLNGNQFSGPPPASIGNSLGLSKLSLAQNNLTGQMVRLSSVSTLTVLDISNNQLYGDLSFLRQMFQLVSLDLSNNLFTGDIFDNGWLSSYGTPKVARVDISNNRFTSKIFWNLPPSVTFLNATNNLFSDSLPPPISLFGAPSSWPLLTEIYASNNSLSGSILTIFTPGSMPSLRNLDLSNNYLVGSISPSMSQLTQLQSLDLSNNQIVGDIPPFLSELQLLTTLNLRNNNLQSEDISFITSLSLLQTLDLSNNNITAIIPEEIGQLTRITSLDLSNNNMYGDIPASMYTIRTIASLMLQNNNLTGNVTLMASDPSQIDISNNYLTGSITQMVNGLSSVALLNMSHNQFTGPVPDLSQKFKLQVVDLSSNELSGSLTTFNTLYNLVTFNISHNNMTGSLPSLSSLAKLQVIDVSYNNFTDNMFIGNIPTSYNGTEKDIACDMTGNSFLCPVTWQSYDICGARCQVLDAQVTSNVSLRLQGNVSSFDVDNFLTVLSSDANITRSRLSVFNIRSGSVIVDLIVGPPPADSTNEGNAQRTVQKIENIASSQKTFGPYDVLDYGNVVPTSSTFAPSTYENNLAVSNNGNSTPVGLIVGLAVGATALLAIILVVVALLLYRRRNERMGLYDRQLAMIDLTEINLGEAKNSVVPFSELKDMNEIGAGAFGIVYKAEWRNLTVAVKQIRAEHVTQRQLTEFLSELSILRRLRAHPNVVLFIGVTFPPDPLSMITEFCEGGSLLDYLTSNVVEQEKKNRFIYDISLGMYHLHREGIVHRDLAARNILLSKHLDAKVADFGMSRQTETEDTPGVTQTTVGPLKWMAPEAIAQRQYSKATDSFSFGVVMWEIITVQEPWKDMTSVEAAIQIVTEGKRLKMPDTLPWLQSLMSMCWMAEPEDRPTFQDMSAHIGKEAGIISDAREGGISSAKNSGTSDDEQLKKRAARSDESADEKTVVRAKGDERQSHYSPVKISRAGKSSV